MRSRGWAAATAVAVMLTGCQSEADRIAEEERRARQLQEASSGIDREQVDEQPVDVRYEVTAEGGIDGGSLGDVAWVDVTETTPGGTSQTEQRASYTARHEFDPGSPVGVLAQAGTDVTSITCAIYVDGEKIAEETSDGRFAVVSCSALP